MVQEDPAGWTLRRTSSLQLPDEELQRLDEEPSTPLEERQCIAALPDTRLTPPSAKDSRYGWVVVGAAWVINILVAGYAKSFGLLYLSIMQQFPGTSTAYSALIMSLMTGFRGILAPVNGALVTVLGPRVCCVCGGLLIVLGFLLSINARSIIHLACTIGGLVGVGMSMSETPGFIIPAQYFEERLSLANGVRTSGNPFGGVLFPFILVLLTQEFPLSGTFMLLAGIMLQICVMGMLMRPFHVHKTIVERKYFKAFPSSTHEDHDSDATQGYKGSKPDNSGKRKVLDFAFLKNPVYLVYIVMIICVSASLANVLYYLALYGTSVGLSGTEISSMVAFNSILDTVTRLAIGWICDKISQKRYVFIFGIMLAGLSCLLVSLAKSYWVLLVMVSIHAIGIAAFWALINTLMTNQFGEDSQPTTWGFFRMTQGVTSFLYPPILGLLADVSGWMGAPFLFMSLMYFLGAIIFAFQPLVIRLSGIRVNLT